jgi:trafficking protein particle complex subunit 13
MSRTNRTPPPTESAVPTLRVMRLQSPELHTQLASSFSSATPPQCRLQTSLCLPDSLIVYVGESFTAYLGVLNTSKTVPIRRLTVSAQLQTPSQRYQLPSTTFDQGNGSGGIDIAPESSIDAIVSRVIEESGQHILRVEVGYLTPEGGTQTFRKFYRFAVLAPLTVQDTAVVRISDTRCFISVIVKYPKIEENQGMIVIASSTLETPSGFTVSKIDATTTTTKNAADVSSVAVSSPPPLSAVQLWDAAGAMSPGGSFSYLFMLEAASKDALLRGIAAGDYLGRAAITWRKAMGESGTVYSSAITCPKSPLECQVVASSGPSLPAVVHRSGWTVDVAAAAAAAANAAQIRTNASTPSPLVVTVEPIDPPSRVPWHVPVTVQFLIVNHSEPHLTLQFQFNPSRMDPGLVVTGSTCQTLGEVPGNGGSIVVPVCFLPLQAGLLYAKGCSVVDLASGQEMIQPPLFATFAEKDTEQ